MLRFVLGMYGDGQRDAVSDGNEMQALLPGSHKDRKNYLLRGPSRQVPEWNKVKLGSRFKPLVYGQQDQAVKARFSARLIDSSFPQTRCGTQQVRCSLCARGKDPVIHVLLLCVLYMYVTMFDLQQFCLLFRDCKHVNDSSQNR